MYLASCVSNVITIDVTPPSMECDTLITIEVDDRCQATTPLLMPTIVDNCGNFTVNQSSIHLVTIGNTIIQQSATDSSGNMNSCETILHVVDNIVPELSCMDKVILDGQLMSNLTEMVNYTDNCNVKSVEQSIPSDTQLEEGEHLVSVVVTDQSGNT